MASPAAKSTASTPITRPPITVLLLVCTLPMIGAQGFFPGDYYGGGYYYYNNNIPPFPGGEFYNPWAAFFNFSDCHFGDSQQGLWQVKQYLANFGYLPGAPSFTNFFDDPFRSAILNYQQFFHLNQTGELDNATLSYMVRPRCGVSDPVNATNPGRNLYAFFPNNPMWPRSKTNLTYAFVSTSAVSIDGAVLRKVFSRAFARWAEVSTLSFSEVDSTMQPDITIGFYSGDHGDGEPFDGQLGTLAHAFSPTDGRFHLDAAEMWVAAADDVAPDNLLQSVAAVDLESVAVHEIGHLLGLGHSSVEGSIMYPTIKTRTRRVQLTSDDIAGIQQLYGNNPSYNGSSSFNGSMSEGRIKNDAPCLRPSDLLVILSTLLLFLLSHL